LIAGKLQLPDNPDLKKALQNTQAFYGKNNALSIAHQRSAAGHADLADAVATAVWIISSKPARVTPSIYIIDTYGASEDKKESAAEKKKRIWEDERAWEGKDYDIF